jgi:hypothetical protein
MDTVDNASKIEKRDFEKLADAWVEDQYQTASWAVRCNARWSYLQAMESHIPPLLSKLQEMREWRTEAEAKLIEAGKALGLQSNEIDLLREENERLKSGLEYARNYLSKGGFGRVDCLKKIESLLKP